MSPKNSSLAYDELLADAQVGYNPEISLVINKQSGVSAQDEIKISGTITLSF